MRKVSGDAERGSRLDPGPLDTLWIASADDDLRSLVGEHARRREPDAACRAGDDADPIAEVELQVSGLRGLVGEPVACEKQARQGGRERSCWAA
jgi:hypothetical protein